MLTVLKKRGFSRYPVSFPEIAVVPAPGLQIPRQHLERPYVVGGHWQRVCDGSHGIIASPRDVSDGRLARVYAAVGLDFGRPWPSVQLSFEDGKERVDPLIARMPGPKGQR